MAASVAASRGRWRRSMRRSGGRAQPSRCDGPSVNARILVATFAYNEGEKIRRTLARHPTERPYDLLVLDDGSTDGALDDVDPRVIVRRNATNQGIGASMKSVFEFALEHRYDILVIQAGNDKDDPLEIPALLQPILQGSAD